LSSSIPGIPPAAGGRGEDAEDGVAAGRAPIPEDDAELVAGNEGADADDEVEGVDDGGRAVGALVAGGLGVLLPLPSEATS
jgi:hypothetical protein